MENETENQLILSNDIMSAFGNPTIDGLKKVSDKRVQELRSLVGPFTVVRRTEEEEWLSIVVTSSDPMDVVRRLPSSILSLPIGLRFLPFMMTVPTDTRWKLGRGVFDCSLYAFEQRAGYLVESIVDSQPTVVQNVVCRYVKFCAEHFEDVAITSWNLFWNRICAHSESACVDVGGDI